MSVKYNDDLALPEQIPNNKKVSLVLFYARCIQPTTFTVCFKIITAAAVKACRLEVFDSNGTMVTGGCIQKVVQPRNFDTPIPIDLRISSDTFKLPFSVEVTITEPNVVKPIITKYTYSLKFI